MATIRETLKQLAADTLPDYTYLFEDWDTADTKLEKLNYPAIVCIIPASGTTEIRNGRVYDTVNVALAYLDTVPRGAEGEDNGECIDRMKVAGARMIRRHQPVAPVRTAGGAAVLRDNHRALEHDRVGRNVLPSADTEHRRV
mgnify:CR=1 FL=1